MNAELNSKFEKLEASRLDLEKILQALDHKALNQAPKPGAWGPLQVVHHLLQSEKGSLIYMKKKLQAERIPKAGLSSWIRAFLLKLYLRTPLKFKAPSVLKEPPSTLEIELLSEWARERKGLRDFLDAFPESRLGEKVYRHPIVGRITLVQALDFLAEHQDRHAKQIRRILGGSG